jgi:hypothetical protein
MFDSIRMIEELVISDALDAQPASVLRVVRVARDLCDPPVFLMDHDATPRHATLANRPDDLFFHASPPDFKNSDHHIRFLRVFQSNLRLPISRDRHPELVSGPMGYRKGEILKKSLHERDLSEVLNFDYELRRRDAGQRKLSINLQR